MDLQDFRADLLLTDYPFAAGEALADFLNLPRAAMTIIVPVSARTASTLVLTKTPGLCSLCHGMQPRQNTKPSF